jgi:hypothetical protein
VALLRIRPNLSWHSKKIVAIRVNSVSQIQGPLVDFPHVVLSLAVRH